ncbi:hypothetical protein VNO80_25908 [Phaseolus coccineus]|uniref:Uncharacterized protein n=1 Tax=Phaseolus coccineus TaxID=3886 RepID=A0AAN9QM95_PHACN
MEVKQGWVCEARLEEHLREKTGRSAVEAPTVRDVKLLWKVSLAGKYGFVSKEQRTLHITFKLQRYSALQVL